MAQQDLATRPAGRRPGLSYTEQLIDPLSRIRSEFDRLFEDFPFRAPTLRFASASALAVPPLEMTETKQAYKLTAELPGLEASDVEVSCEDGVLRIAGEKRDEREEEEQGCRISERSYGAFERLVKLPANADAGTIKARCRNGVLTVTIAKTAGADKASSKIAVEPA